MKTKLLFCTVFVLLIKDIHSAVVPATAATLRACPSKCACSIQEDRGLVTIHCEGQKLSTIPNSDTRMDLLVELDISDNDIKLLPNRVFKQYPNLEKIDASVNTITIIELGAFYGVDFIREVDLSDNIITYIHPNTFSTNLNLKVINLSHNPLTKVSTNVPILNIPMVTTLDISYCQLSWMTQDMFNGMSNLEILDISKNDMTDFPIKTLTGLDRLVNIKVDNNRFSCDDCNLLRTLSSLALQRTEVTEVEDRLSCMDSNGSFIDVSILKTSRSCDKNLILDEPISITNNITETDNETEVFIPERRVHIDGSLWFYLEQHSYAVHTLIVACFILTITFAVLAMMCVMKHSLYQQNVNAKQELMTKNLQLAYSEPDQKLGSMDPLLENFNGSGSQGSTGECIPAMEAGERPWSLYEEYLMTRPVLCY